MKLDSKYFDCVRVKPDHEKVVPEAAPPANGRAAALRACIVRRWGADARASTTCSASTMCAQFNASYNYFAGMSNADVEAYQKDSVTGHRPTWKAGANSVGARHAARHGACGRHMAARFARSA